MNPKKTLKQYGLQPSKRLGQNFLVDGGAINKIIEAADLQPDDTVLEVGPGLGVLTKELAKRAKKVIAVEKDKNMVEILKKSIGSTYGNYGGVKIILGDIREIKNLKLKIKNYKVVGNLPFYLTAPVVRQFLELADVGRPQVSLMVLVVQKEVGQRICSKPPRMNLLAVSVQVYAEPKIISYISKESFWPSPDVDAAIIKITPKPQSLRTPDVRKFFAIVKAGFSQPRKQLINNLSSGLKADKAKIREWLLRNDIQPSRRAETLNIEDWIKLSKSCKIQ